MARPDRDNSFLLSNERLIELDKYIGTAFIIKRNDIHILFTQSTTVPKLYYRNHDIHDSNSIYVGQLFSNRYDMYNL